MAAGTAAYQHGRHEPYQCRRSCPVAFATSATSAQDLKLRILDRSGEDSPPNIKPDLLTYLNSKTGEVVSQDSLTGATQRAVSLTINLNTAQWANTQGQVYLNKC